MNTNAGCGRVAEQVARNSSRRLIAYLAARSRDIAAAEDALAEAFRAELEHWPRTGIPDNPKAWLLTVARRHLIDTARHARVRNNASSTLSVIANEAMRMADTDVQFPDERLKLLFVCTHPAIDKSVHTPLMLQVVLGLNAVHIASAFLVKPAAMGQRLARAKQKIRDAGIPYEVPGMKELPGRLNAVLEAIYAAYGSAWESATDAGMADRGLAAEALELTMLLHQYLPDTPEIMGLLALIMHCEARRPGRNGADGSYVPLSEQNTALWHKEMITQAEQLLEHAGRMGQLGRFQLEAAIQSAHTQRCLTGLQNWNDIALLYEGLIHIAPSIGALVGRSAVVYE